jgi:type IV secretory pathway TraG/TraD family ATPase VirD4
MDYSDEKLKSIFTDYYPVAAKLIEEQSKTTQGFMTVLITKLWWVGVLATAWPDCKDGFSISNWVNNEKSHKVIIIPSDPLYIAISSPLCNALFSIASQYILALQDSDTRRILFALDELGNLPKSESIERWLTTGRSKGIRTIAGIQSISQLHSIYGEHKTETILSLFSSVICLKVGSSGRSAQKASESFGNKIIKREVVSIDMAGNRSTTIQQVEEAVVRREQIIHLPQVRSGVQGFLSINGWDAVYQLTWPFPNISKIAEEYVAATWLMSEKKERVKRRKPGSRGRR